MPHLYKITVEPVDPEAAADGAATMSFTVSNHDDILAIASRMRGLGAVPDDEIPEFAVGLKLFSEVMIRHRKSPLFESLWPHFGDFMKRLKSHQPGNGPG